VSSNFAVKYIIERTKKKGHLRETIVCVKNSKAIEIGQLIKTSNSRVCIVKRYKSKKKKYYS
jgi:hypothetical protein